MSLKDTDTLELLDRYGFVAEKYVKLAIELAPKLEKFGKYRKELQVLTAEFVERDLKIEGTEDLESLIKEEIGKRSEQVDVKTDTNLSGSG
jgi:hypothetical protein